MTRRDKLYSVDRARNHNREIEMCLNELLVLDATYADLRRRQSQVVRANFLAQESCLSLDRPGLISNLGKLGLGRVRRGCELPDVQTRSQGRRPNPTERQQTARRWVAILAGQTQ
jgi:hypothetical protein